MSNTKPTSLKEEGKVNISSKEMPFISFLFFYSGYTILLQ